ncbi:MAG: hypothetical protein NTV73_12470 [Hyphomicrobiales bacterium]|nr:hypothetical protein [Hyphomicrobiales bacterium]
MNTSDNYRETGARSLQRKDRPDANNDVSQKAAENRKPPGGVGNTEKSSDDNEKTRHSDGRQPPKR